jgi:signal transduction histidine kinase
MLARGGERIGDTEPVSLETVARSAWEHVETRDANLVVEETSTVQADRGPLQQALENLFRNNVEHGSLDVTVTVSELGDGEGFYVADDGPGIPEADRESVFEYGFSGGEGTGLGLAIVRNVAEGHGWTVTATESEDGGARFEFRTE